MRYLFAILIAGGLFAFYAWAYQANHRTPVPEGCENARPDCQACGIADCALREKMGETKEKEIQTK